MLLVFEVCVLLNIHNLDTLGISFNKASKLADSSTCVGTSINRRYGLNMAWQDVFSDIRIDGFVNGISKNIQRCFRCIITIFTEVAHTRHRLYEIVIEQHFINTACGHQEHWH